MVSGNNRSLPTGGFYPPYHDEAKNHDNAHIIFMMMTISGTSQALTTVAASQGGDSRLLELLQTLP